MNHYDIGRGIGMTKKEARLWAECCKAEAHYQALKRQGARQELVEAAYKAWDDAAWAYQNWRSQ